MVGKGGGIVLLLCILTLSFTFSEGGKCDDANSLSCPNCGGAPVSDCLECDGFFSTGMIVLLQFMNAVNDEMYIYS